MQTSQLMKHPRRWVRLLTSNAWEWLRWALAGIIAAVFVWQLYVRISPFQEAEALLPGSQVETGTSVDTSPGVSTKEESASVQAAPAQDPVLRPTFSWVNSFSLNSTLDGEPLPVGTEVKVFDPDGTLIGRTVVKGPGKYGLMALYMDDPGTPVDEGAEPGDPLLFTVNGIPQRVVGPDKAVWNMNGDLLQLDIAATSSQPGPGGVAGVVSRLWGGASDVAKDAWRGASGMVKGVFNTLFG